MKIKADLRTLVEGQEQSLLTNATASGVTTLTVDSASNFLVDDHIVIGDLGTESCEIRKITVITGNVLTIGVATVYSHSQDTSVVYCPYNQLNFFYSTTATGSLVALNGSPQTITVDSIYNTYNDTAHSTGFGWYRFYNSVTSTTSDLSNGVPYAGFGVNTVKYVFDNFLTQIQNREKKMIKEEDMYAWLNEAYTIARNRLSMGNREHAVPTPYTITTTAGTAEYDLPPNTYHIRMLTDDNGLPVDPISPEEVPAYNTTANSVVQYYVRNNQVGFVPTPSATNSYSMIYTELGENLSSYLDTIDLPNNNVFFLLDYMLYRATPIIGGNPKNRLEAFTTGLNEMIITSHKKSGGLDSIGIADNAIA